MADWHDVIDCFIAQLDPHVPELNRLQRLFNEKQNMALADAKEGLTTRFQYNRWITLGQQTETSNIENHRQSARQSQLLGIAIDLQAQRRIGQCLDETPPSRGRPKINIRSADNYQHLPKWLKSNEAKRYRGLAKIPKDEWYEFLVNGLKTGTLSLRAGWDLGDENELKRKQKKERKEQANANRQFFLPPKGNSDKAQREAAYQRMCRIHKGDFQQLDMSSLPVKRNEKPVAIITDPPYLQKHFDSKLWEKFADWSLKHLAKDGVLVVMVGNLWLERAISTLVAAGWEYRWTLAVRYQWGKPVHAAKANPFWKPIVVFRRKGDKYRKGDYIDNDAFTVGADMFDAGKRNKKDGEWQQDVETFERLVDYFTRPGNLVVDPFVGFGTTPIACIKQARRFVGSEKLSRRWKKADRKVRTEYRRTETRE